MFGRVLLLVVDAVRPFLSWWGRELAACLPRSLPLQLGLDRPKVWAMIGSSAARFQVVRGRETTNLGDVEFLPDAPGQQTAKVRALLRQSGAGQASIGILMPPAKVLCPTIRLPAATRENLGEVLGFEMDRQTPFRAEDVYFDYRIRSIDAEAGQISVALAITQRRDVDRMISVAGAWGVSVDRVSVAEGPGAGAASFNLLPRTAVRREGTLMRRVLMAEAAVVVLLAAAALALPIYRKMETLDALEARVAALRSEAADVAALRDRISEISQQISFLDDRKRAHPMATVLLAEITRILPDNTWLTELTWRDTDLRIVGYSQQPSSLIALLEESALFGGAQFSAPVTTDPRLGLERFNIAVNVAEDGASQ
jgi:general secretion pathway protein L